jgi:hypothetical protein
MVFTWKRVAGACGVRRFARRTAVREAYGARTAYGETGGERVLRAA